VLVGAFDDPDVAAERKAIAADRWPPERLSPAPTEPPAELVERLADALAARPGHRITNRDQAMPYFRAEVRRRLTLTNDPLARGLLAGAVAADGKQLR
jgi:hypothetical protein